MTMTAGEKLAFATLLTSVASATSIWTISLWGFGTSPDSVVYVAGARSLAAGMGFSLTSSLGDPVPIVQFPPLFSSILAMLSVLNLDPLDGATSLNAALLALNVCLSTALVYRATGVALSGFTAALLTLTAPAILATHTMIWSEPLFLFLVLLTALAVARYQETPSYASLLWVLPAAVLAPLTRYAGLAVLLAAIFTIGRRNLRHAAVFSLAASTGIATWLARNYSVASNATNRSLGFHPPTADQLNLALQTIVEWFGGGLLAIAIVGLIVVTLLRRSQNLESQANANFLLNFAITYGLLLVLTISFADAQTPLDRRILSPLYLPLSIWSVIAITSITTRQFRLVWSGVVVLVILSNSWVSADWLYVLSTQGFGFSSSAWRFSPTMRYLKAHEVTPLHTNAPDPVFLLVGTPAAMLPRHTDPGTRVANLEYPNQIADVGKKGGVVVYFRAVKWRWYLPDEERLKAELGVRLIADLGDGAVYATTPTSAISPLKDLAN